MFVREKASLLPITKLVVDDRGIILMSVVWENERGGVDHGMSV